MSTATATPNPASPPSPTPVTGAAPVAGAPGKVNPTASLYVGEISPYFPLPLPPTPFLSRGSFLIFSLPPTPIFI